MVKVFAITPNLIMGLIIERSSLISPEHFEAEISETIGLLRSHNVPERIWQMDYTVLQVLAETEKRK